MDQGKEIQFTIGEIGYLFYVVGDQKIEGAKLTAGGHVVIESANVAKKLINALKNVPDHIKIGDGMRTPGNILAANRINEAFFVELGG